MAAALVSPSRATFSLHDGDDDVPFCTTPLVTAHADYTLDAEVNAFQLDGDIGAGSLTPDYGAMSAAQRQLAWLHIEEEGAGEDSCMSSDSDASPSASSESDQSFGESWRDYSPASSTASFDTAKSVSPTAAVGRSPLAASSLLAARPAPLQRTASESMVRSYSTPVATQAETDASRRVWERQQVVAPPSSSSTLATIASPSRARSSDDLTPRSSMSEDRPMLAYPYNLLGSRAPTPTGGAGMYARSYAHGQATPASPTTSPKSAAGQRPALGRFMSYDPASFVRVGGARA